MLFHCFHHYFGAHITKNTATIIFPQWGFLQPGNGGVPHILATMVTMATEAQITNEEANKTNFYIHS
jgi:hypothetical protein